MIGYLLKLKERFESCKDPEKEIVQKIWRFILIECFSFCFVHKVNESSTLST